MGIFAAEALNLVAIALITIAYLKLTKSIGRLREVASADFLRDFVTSKKGLVFALLWAVEESVYWWIFPDSLLMIVAMYARRFFLRVLVYAVIGTALGGALALRFAVGYLGGVSGRETGGEVLQDGANALRGGGIYGAVHADPGVHAEGGSVGGALRS